MLPLEHIDDTVVRGGPQLKKLLKRLRNDDDVNTGLKPGENEIEDFEAKPMSVMLTADFESNPRTARAGMSQQRFPAM